MWRNYCIHIYTHAYTFSVLSRLCRKLFEYARTFWHPLSHNLTTFLKYWRFSITNASKARDLLWPIPSPTKFFLSKRCWSYGTYWGLHVVCVLKYDSYKISSLEVIGLNFSGNVTFCNSLVYVYKTLNFLTWHLHASNFFKFVQVKKLCKESVLINHPPECKFIIQEYHNFKLKISLSCILPDGFIIAVQLRKWIKFQLSQLKCFLQ